MSIVAFTRRRAIVAIAAGAYTLCGVIAYTLLAW